MATDSGGNDGRRGEELHNGKAPDGSLQDQVGVLLLSVATVARKLGRSKARIYELCASGDLRCVRDGASVLIPADEPEKWVRRKLRQQSP